MSSQKGDETAPTIPSIQSQHASSEIVNTKGPAEVQDTQSVAATVHNTSDDRSEDMNKTNAHIIEIYPYYPTGVSTIIATGSEHYLGLVDSDTVLKFPHLPHESEGIHIEQSILSVLGKHPRIASMKGHHNEGLLLEYACNGSVGEYLRDCEKKPALAERLKWCRQAAEAMLYVHSKNVIHRDINISNLLLDSNYDIKLCDFQGFLLNEDGSVKLNGRSGENIKSSKPRIDPFYGDVSTDIFALGSAIFYILYNELPFPELDPWNDKEEIVARFTSGNFGDLDQRPGGTVVRGCWMGSYDTAEDVVHALTALELEASDVLQTN